MFKWKRNKNKTTEDSLSFYERMLLVEMRKIDHWNDRCKRQNKLAEEVIRITREESFMDTPLGFVVNFRNPNTFTMIEHPYTEDMIKLKEKLKKK